MPSAEQMMRAAKAERQRGDAAAAEASYAAAARLALDEGSPALRAHALRHVAELAAERDAGDLALEAASEALQIYAADEPESLNLANAHRVRALALRCLGQSEGASSDWREARRLYERLGIEAGVAECDRRLNTA